MKPKINPGAPDDEYQAARDLLGALIAAYSARIAAAGPAEAAQLRGERAPLLSARQTLDPADREQVRRILADTPARLAAVRGDQ